MHNATDISRKMDFSMRTNGPDYIPLDNNLLDFGRVEIITEHTI